MNHNEIEILNNILQGTYMGIDSYTKYLNNIDNPDIRHKIENQERIYRENALELESHIRNLGGNPKDNAGLKGVMTSLTSSMKLIGDDKTPKALEMIKDGVKIAIDLKKDSIQELSQNSKQLIENQLQADRTILSEVKSFIDQTKH